MQIKFLKNSRYILILIFVLLIVSFGYFYKFKSFPQSENNPIIASKDIGNYYKIYQDPYVINLRQSLNNYLTNGNGINDLVSYDSSYYKCKFVVLTINNNLGGGKDVQIIFQDKPDKVFSAWVYKLATGEYELRSFNVKNYDQKAINKIISSYKSLIIDKSHSI